VVVDQKTDRGTVEQASAGWPDALELQRISTLLIQEGDIDALYARVLETATDLTSADMASLQAFSSDRGELRLLAHRGFHPESAAFWEIVCVNSASSCALAMSSGARTIVPDIEACESMADTADLDAYRRSGIRAVQSTPLISRSGQLLGMISTHWRNPHQPTEFSLRPFDVLARQAADLIERVQVESMLRESEERSRWLASIVESSDDAIVSTSLDGAITSWNRGAERIFGYFAEEVVGKSITILLPANRSDEGPAILNRVRCGEHVDHYETVRQRKDGSLIDISLTVSPIKNIRSEIVGASKISRDITERKRNEARIVILAREAEHRAKNMLANVLAAVHLSRSDTPDGLKQSIEGRVQALANVHSLVVQSGWIGAELRSVVMQELSPYSLDGDGRAQIEGPLLLLEPDTAQAIAITLHELTTNAAKYGALSVSDGRVRVEWSQAQSGRVALRWTETNGPAVKPPTQKGFGTRVIESMIGTHLKGQVHFVWSEQGLACEIAW
jgi:PAS domain S-box-containing protein